MYLLICLSTSASLFPIGMKELNLSAAIAAFIASIRAGIILIEWTVYLLYYILAQWSKFFPQKYPLTARNLTKNDTA